VYGHVAGAEAVRTVGRVIAAELPPEAVACRYGGDEFVVALPHCTTARAKLFADRVRTAVQTTEPVLAGRPFPAGTLSISIGIAGTASRPEAPVSDAAFGESLFQAADAALYVAKAEGRNRVHVNAGGLAIHANAPEIH
jgi:diguanylate cyclase (GGDEF)-like protein